MGSGRLKEWDSKFEFEIEVKEKLGSVERDGDAGVLHPSLRLRVGSTNGEMSDANVVTASPRGGVRAAARFLSFHAINCWQQKRWKNGNNQKDRTTLTLIRLECGRRQDDIVIATKGRDADLQRLHSPIGCVICPKCYASLTRSMVSRRLTFGACSRKS